MSIISTYPTARSGYVLTMGVSGYPVWQAAQGAVDKESYTNPALTPSSGVCTWTIDHTLDTRGVTVEIYDASTYKKVIMDVIHTSTSQVTIKFNAGSNVSAGTYKAVLVG